VIGLNAREVSLGGSEAIVRVASLEAVRAMD
jgi:hypothetical protein